MDVIVDLIGSFIIRGAIVLISLNLMIMMNDSLLRSTEQSYMNEIIDAPALTLTNDLRAAGYNASKNFLIAQKQEVRFCTDVDNNFIPDTINFYLSTRDPVTHHQVLYRKINYSGKILEISRQVDTINFTYFDEFGRKLGYRNNRDSVKSIFVQLRLESENVITTLLSGSNDSLKLKSFWENHIFPKNL